MRFDSLENQTRKVQILRDFQDYLKSRKVKPARLERVICEVCEEIDEPKAPDFARIARAFSEAEELTTIFLHLPELREISPQFWKRIFGRPSGGKSEESVDARDRQYEIWLTAFMVRAGLNALWSRDASEKADVELVFEDTEIYISAKRPRSLSSLPNTLDQAIQNLSSKLGPSGRLGIVAVNLDEVWLDSFGRDHILQGNERFITQRVNEFWATLRPEAANKMHINHRRIAGMMITLNVTAIQHLPEGCCFTTLTRYQFEESSDRQIRRDLQRLDFLERLARAFQPDRFDISALPRVERASDKS